MLRSADDGVAVDEVVGERRRLRAALPAVRRHVVAFVQVAEDFPLLVVRRPRHLAVHDREACEEPGAGAAQLPADSHVVVADDVDVGAEPKRVRIASRQPGRFPGGLDPPGDPSRFGTHGEHDPVGVAGRDADHLGPGGRDIDRHLRSVADPLDRAYTRAARESELVFRWRSLVGNGRIGERHRFATEVGLQALEVVLEPAEPCRRATQVRQGTVTATDSQHHAALGHALQCERRARSHRRVPRHGVGDRRGESQAVGRRRPEGQADVGIAGQVLRVHHQHPVPAFGLGLFGERRAPCRGRHRGSPEFHAAPLQLHGGKLKPMRRLGLELAQVNDSPGRGER